MPSKSVRVCVHQLAERNYANLSRYAKTAHRKQSSAFQFVVFSRIQMRTDDTVFENVNVNGVNDKPVSLRTL